MSVLTWSDVASSTCLKTTVKLCVLGRMPCELHDILKESFRFMPVVRYCSVICELCCKFWVDRCYRHLLQSCMPCGVCMWGSNICTHVDIRVTECCVEHTLMLSSGSYDRFKYLLLPTSPMKGFIVSVIIWSV